MNPFSDLPHTYSIPMYHEADRSWLVYQDHNPHDSAWAFSLGRLVLA